MTLSYNYKHILIAVMMLLIFQPLTAQDGKALFKANCAACHNMKQKLVGPALKGIVKKWNDAGEGEMLKEWIINPKELKDSGKSKLAVEAWNFSPVDMTPFLHLKSEEIDAIILYMKDWAPPAKKVAKVAIGDGEIAANIVIQEDNSANSLIFILLFIIMLILLASIVVFDKVIKQVTLRTINSNKAGITIFLIASSLILPSTGNALSIDFKADPILTVSSTDIYFLLGMVIMLFGLLFYLRSILNRFIQAKYSQATELKEKTVLLSLTEAVPIEDEASILLDHDYDGIQELDNVLPPWWLWGFYFTIVFAVVYMFNYHVFNTGDLQTAEYEKSMVLAQIKVDAYNEMHGMTVDLSSLVVMTDESDINAGEEIFKKSGNCFTCHLVTGAGQIGPNLTDDAWLYEKNIKSMYSLIHDGTDKGMPPMGGASLNPIQIQQVASYILQLEYVKGKAPEGDKK